MLATVGLAVLVIWAGLMLQTLMIEKVEHELEIEALLIANALRDALGNWVEGELPSGRPIGNLVLSYAEETRSRIIVALPDGSIVFSSDPDTPLEALPSSVELRAALALTEQHNIRPDDFGSGQLRLYTAAPVVQGDQVLGLVQLSVPYGPIQREIQAMWLRLILVSAGLVAAIGFASVLLARRLSAPIRHLTEMADRMARGDLEAPVRPHGPHEIRRLAVAFETMARRVREMLAQQRQFVDNAAHELRSPLASIRLRIDMLARLANGHAGNRERFERYLRETEAQLAGLEQLVNDLLLLSSVEEEEMPAALLDLSPLLYELADEMAPLVREKAHRLVLEVPPHLPPVKGNETYLRVAVRNLLDNAIKYTPAGGTITLRARAEAGEVIVEVEDTGPGIPDEEVAHVFDRFYRSRAARGSRITGVGLGLALVHTIVTRHGGRVGVESRPGAGTCFRIYLPTAQHNPPAGADPAGG